MYIDRGRSGAHSHIKISPQNYFPELLKIGQILKNVQKFGAWPKNQRVGRVIMWEAQENYISKISSHDPTYESAMKIKEKYFPALLKIV